MLRPPFEVRPESLNLWFSFLGRYCDRCRQLRVLDRRQRLPLKVVDVIHGRPRLCRLVLAGGLRVKASVEKVTCIAGLKAMEWRPDLQLVLVAA
jgi:hypothetical protein